MLIQKKTTTNYVHLKSMASLEEFEWFEENIKTLNKIYKTKSQKCEKVDLNGLGEKITFDSEKKVLSFKSKKSLFRPNYETVKNGKIFRISFISQGKGDDEPKRKVIDTLDHVINKVFQVQQQKILKEGSQGGKGKFEGKKIETTSQKPCKKHDNANQGPSDRQPPLRFKSEQTIFLNDCFSLVMNRVYQVINIKLYQSIRDLVNNRRNSSNQIIGRFLLSEMVEEIFDEMKNDLTYEVELRFNPGFLKQFDDMDEEEIYEIMDMAGEIFVLSVNPKEFSAEEVVQLVNKIEKS